MEFILNYLTNGFCFLINYIKQLQMKKKNVLPANQKLYIISPVTNNISKSLLMLKQQHHLTLQIQL